MKTKYDIFISYRRVGGAQYARILQLMLQQRGYRVFLDYDELTDGKFSEHIKAAIKDAPIFLIVLSKESLSRCKNDNDWVRQEILLALEHKKHIVPINPDNTFDGIPKDIPAQIIEELGTHQYSEISFGQTLGISVDFMVENRISPKIGQRLRQDSDISFLKKQLITEDEALHKHRLFIKSIICLGILSVILIIGGFCYNSYNLNAKKEKRENLIKQVQSRHKELDFMGNDSITTEQIKVIDELFSNLAIIKGDTLRISAFETTIRQFNTILGKDYDKSDAMLPITNVSFGAVQQYIVKLNQLINYDLIGYYFYLPTEEEWEYVASQDYIDEKGEYSGINSPDSVAWFIENSGGEPHQSDGQNRLHPNKIGVYDMIGNVSEFVITPYIDPSNPEIPTNLCVAKGGNYSSSISELDIKKRIIMEADVSSPRVGFRLILRKL